VKRFLVTGSCGFIGYHLIKKILFESTDKVIIIDNLSNTNNLFLDKIHEYEKNFGERLVFYKKDIREPLNEIIQKEDINICIHLAAKISVSDSIINPFETIDVNIRGTLNLLEACSKGNVENFVFASTGAVYGEPTHLPIAENHRLNPLSPYGATKIAGEALISSYKNMKKIKNAIILRFFNVYGDGQSPSYAGVITKFAERLSKGLAPIIFGDGEQTREFISVNDIANALLLATVSKSSSVEEFNIATGKPISINYLAETMTKLFGMDLAPIYKEEQTGDIKYAHVDVTKAKEILKFTANKDFQEELKGMFINNPNNL
jgi:UDP-glucose 4-epimerase